MTFRRTGTVTVDQFVAARPSAVWTLTWVVVAEGDGTRVLLEHSGFDLDDHRERDACERMEPGWRDVVLPRLAETAAQGAAAPR